MAAAMPKPEDRRLFERFFARYPARVIGSADGFGDSLFLEDASAQGARVNSRGAFHLNDNVMVEVDLQDNKNPMTLKGKVIWAKPKGDESWDIGMKFHEVNFMNMSRLYEQSISAT